jgi:hypothetical protein
MAGYRWSFSELNSSTVVVAPFVQSIKDQNLHRPQLQTEAEGSREENQMRPPVTQS